jgi:ribosomal protein S12 methylthiotransferase
MSGADTDSTPAAYFFFNLGCPKNLVDAERVAARLEGAGWRAAPAPEEAHLLVVTTCAFITRAEEESIDEILRVASEKKQWQRLAVLGCLVSREGDRLPELLPEVDLFLSVDEMECLPERLAGEPHVPRISVHSPDYRIHRRLFTPSHVAYLKIAEGCSNRCSYCTIPAIRGELRSREPGGITEEAAWLVGRGVKELVVVAQDTAAWGSERGNGRSVWGLLESISAVTGTAWIRLMYIHPAHLDLESLVRLLSEGKICCYVDIPIQHVSDDVLHGMRRRYGGADLHRLFDALRSRVDCLVMRTTVMVGFPGETDDSFQSLLDFLVDYEFDHVGVFAYSPEPGTAAVELDGRIPADEVLRRRDEVLDLQMDISHRRLQARVGGVESILVDEHLSDGESPSPGVWGMGRFYGQAFEVDGVTFLSGKRFPPGSLVRGRIEEAEAYDLFARVF